MSENISLDPLFVGLTRPTLFLGVSQNYVVLNGMISMSYYIQSHDIKVFALSIVIHLIGYIACFNEPLIIELFLSRMKNCSQCKNKMFHGANSYDVY